MQHAGNVPRNVAQKWQFGVEIDGFPVAFFTKSTLPEVEFEETLFQPGGALYDQKMAGRPTFNDVEMEKGIPQDDSDMSLLDWVRQCINVSQGTGTAPAAYMKDVDIVRYKRDGSVHKRYRLYDAWVKTANFGELEGGSSDADIEKMTLCYQYFDVV